jgi:hypothetical protein
MKRSALSHSVVTVLLAVSSIVFGQSNVRLETGREARQSACEFSITGLWRTDATSQNNPLYFDFSPEGWVVLLGYSPNALPQEFETVESVQYKLDRPSNPRAIEFTAIRGNDAFVKGVTRLKILEYSDDRFTTRNVETGEERTWIREQTHKYFLAFAARSGTDPSGGPAFAMWTMMDGRLTKVDALGVQIAKDAEGKSLPVFGPIPAEIYDETREQSEEEKRTAKEEIVIMRFELTRREFEKAHKVFETWDRLVKTRTVPAIDPYLNAMDFIKEAADRLEPCGENVKLKKLDRNATDEIIKKNQPSHRTLEFIKALKQKNLELHVPDKLFPWGWRPMLQLPVQ